MTGFDALDAGVLDKDPGTSFYSAGSFGPHTLPLTFTVENDTDYDRTEIVGVMVGFPDGQNAILPSEISNYHMYLYGGRETVGFSMYNTYGNSTTGIAARFTTTIPWVASLNGITAGSGNIQPGTCKLTFYYYASSTNKAKVELYDVVDPSNPNLGRYSTGASQTPLHPAIDNASYINYTTGEVSIRFVNLPNTIEDKPIRITYQFANPVKYPTQWTILNTWPTGKVRTAKAWIGQASGAGMFISKKISSITAQLSNGTAFGKTMPTEYTRCYLKVGQDPSVNLGLPTYAQHSALTTALSSYSFNSTVYDAYNTYHAFNITSSSSAFEEYVVEDPSRNGGKGWMKVIQRRGYHQNYNGSSYFGCFGSATRDFLSSSSYLYIPHNSRHFEIETRLGNDYTGTDAYEFPVTESLGTGNGVAKTFSATMTHCYQKTTGTNDIDGNIRKGRTKIYLDSTLIGWDLAGDGNFISQSSHNITGTVNYDTGVVNVIFPASGPAPASGVAITCSYKTHYYRIGLASGVATVNHTLSVKPSQYSIHVRVGGTGGSAAQYEGWDGGSKYLASTSQIVPYFYTTVDITQLQAAPLTTTVTGNLQTNCVPGTVGFFADTSAGGALATWWARDDGTGALYGRNLSSGTIDYVTGAYSITFSSTPTSSFNLYATYGRTTSARPISGTINYSTKELSVTTSQSVPSNTPIFVSMFRNKLAGRSHDPNCHPIGNVGLLRWILASTSGADIDFELEGAEAYDTRSGFSGATKYATVLSTGVIPSVGNDINIGEHMADGTSITRLAILYSATGASAAENNTWTARKIHKITPIPTVDCYDASRAYNYLELSHKIVTPEQANTTAYKELARNYSEDVGRRISDLTVPYPNPASVPGLAFGGLMGGKTSSNAFSAVDVWDNGKLKSNSATKCARYNCGWRESPYTGTAGTGATRAMHDSACYMITSQAWQAVRYLYHASLFWSARHGMSLWNNAACVKWDDRAYHAFVGAQNSKGMLKGATPYTTSAYCFDTQEWLNRGWRYGYGIGGLSVTNNSTRVEFNYWTTQSTGSGASQTPTSLVPIWNTNNSAIGFSINTPNGANSSTSLVGMRRIFIYGSTKTYTVANIVWEAATSKWVGTLDVAYQGATASNVSYALSCEPRPGVDSVFLRNDPRVYPSLKLGCYNRSQSSMDGESSSHQSYIVGSDIWNLTGSWAVWENVRHRAEMNLTSVKQYYLYGYGSFTKDQQRSNAWTFNSLISGYHAVKYLSDQPGFEFLTDPDYGSAKQRYADWIRTRWSQWVNHGPSGLMDPLNQIGTYKVVDIPITSSAVGQADWSNMSYIGSPNPAYGGNGTFSTAQNRWIGDTEAQVRFDSLGFDYISVWEVGYSSAWTAATYREFRFDQTPVDLPRRNQYGVPFGSVIFRAFDANVKFYLNYGFLEGADTIAVEKRYPGFVIMNVQGQPDPFVSSLQGLVYPLLESSKGTPIQYYETNKGSAANESSGLVVDTWAPVVWPAIAVSDINYAIFPIYYLRSGSRSLASAYDGDSIDFIGYNLPGYGPGGTKVPPSQFANPQNNFTSFELGWKSSGIPSDGNSIIPEGETNTPNFSNGYFPNVRAPIIGETATFMGYTWEYNALAWSNAPLLANAAKFHPESTIRAQAGDVLNKMVWQSLGKSIIRSAYDQADDYNKGEALEHNYFGALVTGDFPYATDTSSQPVDRWWDQSYASRRRITSGSSHSAYVAGQDVFVIDLTAYSIPAKVFQQDGSDIRVVRQTSDGTNQVFSTILRRAPSGQWNLFVIPSVGITANQSIQSISTESWYIYYGNLSSGIVPWINTNSIDGPYSSDSSTKLLWNQNGGFATDAGPNNWQLGTFTLLEPDYDDGPYGGSVSINRLNNDIAFSSQAIALAQSVTPNYLGSAFTVEFQLYVGVNNYEVDRLGNYGIFSLADSNIFPLISYIETGTRKILFSTSLGSGTYSVFNSAINGPARQVIGTGNGSATAFSANIGAGRIPGTVAVSIGTGTVYGHDDGSGVITGTGIAGSSTINYTTGDIVVNTSSAVANAVPVVAYSNSATNTWALHKWNHIRLSYNGTRLLVSVNGVQVGTTTASGSLQTVPENSGSGVSLGALFTPADAFTARSILKLAEFRVSNSDRGLPSTVANRFQVTLLAEETQLQAKTYTSPSVSGYVAPLLNFTQSGGLYIALSNTYTGPDTDMLLLTGVNLQSTNDADGYVGSADLAVLQQADLAIYIEKTALLTAAGYVAKHLSVELNDVDCLVVLPNESTIDVDCNIIGLKLSRALNCACYVAAESTTRLTCVMSIEWPDAIEQSATAGGYVSVAKICELQCDTYVAPGFSYGTRAGGTVAIDGVVRKVATLAVQTANTTSNTADCLIAGFGATGIGTVNPADGYVAGLVRSTAQVVCDIYSNNQQISIATPVVGFVVSGNMQVSSPATGYVATHMVVQGNIDATIASSPSVSIPAALAVQENNISKFDWADGYVQLNGTQSISNDVTASIYVRQVVVLSSTGLVYSGKTASATASGRVVGSSIDIGIPASLCVVVAADPVSVDVGGELALARTVTLSAEASFADLIRMSASAEMFLLADQMTVPATAEATIAKQAISFAEASGFVSTVRTHNTVCRGFVVLSLDHRLNATGVDTTSGSETS